MTAPDPTPADGDVCCIPGTYPAFGHHDTNCRNHRPPAAPDTGDVDALKAAIRTGLRKCRVEGGAPVPLIREGDLLHITHMVAAEVAEHAAEIAARTLEREALFWNGTKRITLDRVAARLRDSAGHLRRRARS